MKSKVFNIALPEELVKKIDKLAQKEYRNRSELIREALRVYLRNEEIADRELLDWTNKFIDRYKPALKALSKK